MTNVLRLDAPPLSGNPVRELWADLSASMRLLRRNAGMSLRTAEAASGRGRGVLSQIENAKARPNRDLVEWYDTAFGGDGLLLTMYFEARGAHGTDAPLRPTTRRTRDGDAVTIGGATLAYGALVRAGETDLRAGWTLANDGTVPWVGRKLRRVGAHAATRLIASAVAVDLPDCPPAGRVDMQVAFDMPDQPGTFAAYWQIVDADSYPCFEPPVLVSVLVVAAF